MKNIIIFLSLTMGFSSVLTAQNPKPTATPPTGTYSARGKFGISDVQNIEKFLKTIEGVGSSSKELLAEQSLKSYMMPPRKMPVTSPADCYAITSCLEFYINLNNNYKDNLSPDFIKLNLPQGTIEDELAFLAINGTVSAAILPYESPNLTPSVNAGVKYKIKNYIKLFQPTTRPQQKMYDLRKAITRGNPVIVELQITNEFKNLRQARTWNAADGDKTPAGVHTLIVVGYDENKKMVELLNSWGREWGNNGYIWMSYDDFGNLASNGYVLML
jgi:Papain family cysteine protease